MVFSWGKRNPFYYQQVTKISPIKVKIHLDPAFAYGSLLLKHMNRGNGFLGPFWGIGNEADNQEPDQRHEANGIEGNGDPPEIGEITQ